MFEFIIRVLLPLRGCLTTTVPSDMALIRQSLLPCQLSTHVTPVTPGQLWLPLRSSIYNDGGHCLSLPLS
jgi:hypothetical protein